MSKHSEGGLILRKSLSKSIDERGDYSVSVMIDGRLHIIAEFFEMTSRDNREPAKANAELFMASPGLLESCRDTIAWIERRLQSTEHRTVYDDAGNPVNGFTFSPVPEWEMRQKLHSLKEVVLAAEGGSS